MKSLLVGQKYEYLVPLKPQNSLTHLMWSTARIFKTCVATESVPSDGS